MKEMIEILQRIGLTRGESEVYITLLKTGNTSSGRLIKDSGVSRSKVYEVLERLKQKGLVTEMIKQNIKYFEAGSPRRLLDMLKAEQNDIDKKTRETKSLIPQLLEVQSIHREKQESKIYTVIEGWKALYNEILEIHMRGEEYLAFGMSPEDLSNKQVQQFFRNFHLKRAEKKIKARLIMHEKTREIMKKYFSDITYYQYRFLDTKFPTNINIHKDNVVTLVWDENPVAFLIQSKQVAKKYKEYFEEMWKKAKS